MGFLTKAHELRPAPLDVLLEARHRLTPDRHDALLRSLSAGTEHGRLEIDVAELQGYRLRGAQPAGVHRLQQRAITQRGRRRSPWLGEQASDFVAREHRW